MPAQYLATGHLTGEECSSTYEGRHLTIEESLLAHPAHSPDLVHGGDPVVLGESIVGVAFAGASAATDLIAIDTEGIWFLTCTAEDESGNSPIAPGDQLYIDKITAVISKISDLSSPPGITTRFGYALGDLATGTMGVVAVKVHAI